MSGSSPFISIIIPVYNEAGEIGLLLERLRDELDSDPSCECLLVDAGSPDRTADVIASHNFKVLQSPRKGRAAQMNYGATQSRGDLLYFLHADTFPPAGFLQQIRAASRSSEAGCFRLRFDEQRAVMKLYGWFTRFDLLPFRYGDQSLFVQRHAFNALNGFDESLLVMEDNDFIRKLRKRATFRVMDAEVVTSARKYRENGFVRLQLIFTVIFLLFYAGASQEVLVRFYRDTVQRSNV